MLLDGVFAAAAGEVVLVGVLDHFEIWEPKAQEEYFKAKDKEYESLASEAK